TSGDAPHMGAIYKMVELDISGIKRFTAKYSEDKSSLPGAKQIFRDVARDVVARSGECGKGEALLRPIILGGRLIEPLPGLAQARDRAAQSIANLPPALRQLEVAVPWPVIQSRELRELIGQTRSNLRAGKPFSSISIRNWTSCTPREPATSPARSTSCLPSRASTATPRRTASP